MRWPSWKAKTRAFKRLGYQPHGRQKQAHKSEATVVLVMGAERSGKSAWTAQEILASLTYCRRIAIAAQEYDETRPEMEYLITGLRRMNMLRDKSTPQTGQWRASAWNDEKGGYCQIDTVSLHDGPEELTGTGQAYDIVALVEAGRIRYDAFLAAAGRVAQVGGRILLSGTAWDNFGWYVDLYRSFAGPNVFDGEAFSFPAWDNRAVYPKGREDPKIKWLEATLPTDEFARRVAAKLLPSPARIYPEFEYATHVEEVEFDPDLPVELALDAGYYPSHYAVLALQVAQEQIELESGSHVTLEVVYQVDEIWEHRLTHEDVFEMCRDRPWWPNVEVIVAGHEAKQHQAAESTQEVWENMLRGVDRTDVRFEVVDAGRVLDGVARVRTFLDDPAGAGPRYFVDPTCTGTLEEFQSYKRLTDQRGEVRSEEPEDKNNDAMDALRNWIVERFGLVEGVPVAPTPGRRRRPARG